MKRRFKFIFSPYMSITVKASTREAAYDQIHLLGLFTKIQRVLEISDERQSD